MKQRGLSTRHSREEAHQADRAVRVRCGHGGGAGEFARDAASHYGGHGGEDNRGNPNLAHDVCDEQDPCRKSEICVFVKETEKRL